MAPKQQNPTSSQPPTPCPVCDSYICTRHPLPAALPSSPNTNPIITTPLSTPRASTQPTKHFSHLSVHPTPISNSKGQTTYETFTLIDHPQHKADREVIEDPIDSDDFVLILPPRPCEIDDHNNTNDTMDGDFVVIGDENAEFKTGFPCTCLRSMPQTKKVEAKDKRHNYKQPGSPHPTKFYSRPSTSSESSGGGVRGFDERMSSVTTWLSEVHVEASAGLTPYSNPNQDPNLDTREATTLDGLGRVADSLPDSLSAKDEEFVPVAVTARMGSIEKRSGDMARAIEMKEESDRDYALRVHVKAKFEARREERGYFGRGREVEQETKLVNEEQWRRRGSVEKGYGMGSSGGQGEDARFENTEFEDQFGGVD